jgi:hypothetical protein
MLIEVTHNGIRDQSGARIPVGTILDIGDAIPPGMVNKVKVVQDAPPPEAVLTVDTVPTMQLPTGKRGR